MFKTICINDILDIFTAFFSYGHNNHKVRFNFYDFARKITFRTYKSLLVKAILPTNASSKLYSDNKDD